jgi:signal peptidase I
MMPSLHDRQVALMDRGIPREKPLQRGDVIAFRHGREVFVKRVYAIAGDVVQTVRFSNGLTLLARECPIPLDKVRRYARTHPDSVVFARRIVPAGSVYVLGDNRFCSLDSRVFGDVSGADILGRVYTPREAIASLPARLIGVAYQGTSVRPLSL